MAMSLKNVRNFIKKIGSPKSKKQTSSKAPFLGMRLVQYFYTVTWFALESEIIIVSEKRFIQICKIHRNRRIKGRILVVHRV